MQNTSKPIGDLRSKSGVLGPQKPKKPVFEPPEL